MSTGSLQWQDLKSDFELIDDAIAGAILTNDQEGGLDIRKYKEALLSFKERVSNYVPKNESEATEKETLENKIAIGFRILDLLS